jgi:hypothetical protein
MPNYGIVYMKVEWRVKFPTPYSKPLFGEWRKRLLARALVCAKIAGRQPSLL